MNQKHHIAGPTIVRAVMSRIERGRLRPGEHVMPQELARALGTSSTPVREALCQLVGCDILIERPREGFYVAPISSGTLRSLYIAHGRVMEAMLDRWHVGTRLGGNAKRPWPLFACVAAALADDAMAGVQRYLAGRLAVARKHEAVHVTCQTAAPGLVTALRAGDASIARAKSRDFHQACEAAASRIWQSMSDM